MRYYQSTCYDKIGQHGACGPARHFAGKFGGRSELEAYHLALADCLGWLLSQEGVTAIKNPKASNPCWYVGVEGGGGPGGRRWAVLHCSREYLDYLASIPGENWGAPSTRRAFLAAAEKCIETGRPSFFTLSR